METNNQMNPVGIYVGSIELNTMVRVRGEGNQRLSPQTDPLPCAGSEYVSEEDLANNI